MNDIPKKLMLLGGLRYLLPIIRVAHSLGIHVITVDYIPSNIAHKFSDEYYNVSITDKEEILKLATKLDIDGIMSFAVDPGVITAAYVAEKMHLPFQGSYSSINILQNKSRFREFLSVHNFNVPKAKGYDNKQEAIIESKDWKYPVIVKPVDSAGSKGVSKVTEPSSLGLAIDYAISKSQSGGFIIEEFIINRGPSSDSDSFTINGDLVICTFSNQYFDSNASNPFTPAAYSWPSLIDIEKQEELKRELQRLMFLLDMKTGIYNIETRIGEDGKAYIMEVSPRGGGNRLAEMVDIIYDTNLIENSVRASVNLPLLPINISEPKGFYTEIILHSKNSGEFDTIELSKEIQPYLIETDLWVSKGEYVSDFKGANNAIGTLVLRFESKEKLNPSVS